MYKFEYTYIPKEKEKKKKEEFQDIWKHMSNCNDWNVEPSFGYLRYPASSMHLIVFAYIFMSGMDLY